MLGRLSKKSRHAAKSALKDTESKLALLKLELAAQQVSLARQTDDLAPLMAASEALLEARRLFTYELCPKEVLTVQRALADTQLRLARAHKDKAAIRTARDYYRSAITLASMLGEDEQREDIRINMKIAESLLGRRPQATSLFDAA